MNELSPLRGVSRLNVLNVSVDTERMRNRPTFRFEVLERTSHYRIINGRTYRDCIARRLEDGALRVIGIPA